MKYVMVITGTRKGIGRYLAEYYLEKGNTVIGCSRLPSDLEHNSYHHEICDVTDESIVRGLFHKILKRENKIDVLLNNAGIASMNHILTTPLKTVEELISTNFIGTFLFCREAAKVMARKKYGRIVNFGTIATDLKLEGEAIYASSKAAVINLTQIMGREFSPLGITVNAICPTPTKTDLVRNVPEDKMEKIIARQGIHRFTEMRDISNVVDFFISENSDFITGQILNLGGV